MQACVHTLVILYVDGNLARQMQRLTTFSFDPLEVGPHHIISFAGGNPLREFAGMVGKNLPPGFFLPSAPNIYLHSVDGMVIRSPDRAEDKRIGIGRFQLLGRRNRGYAGKHCWIEKKDYKEKEYVNG